MFGFAARKLLAALTLCAGVMLSAVCAPLPSLDPQFALLAERSYLAPQESIYRLTKLRLAHPVLSVHHQALLYENMSRAKWNAKDFPGALHEATLLTALGRQYGDYTIECLGLLQQVYAHWMMGKIQKAYAFARQAEQIPASALSKNAQVKLLITMAQVQAEEGSIRAALSTSGEAVRVAATIDDEAAQFLATKFQTNLALTAHDTPLALSGADRLLALGRKSPYRERMVRARNIEYAVAAVAGLTIRAGEAMEESIALMRKLDLDEALGGALIDYADFQLKRNFAKEAIALSGEALTMETVLSNPQRVSRAHFNHAIALIQLGKMADGRKEVERVLTSNLPRAELLAYLPLYAQALTQAGDTAGSLQASAMHKQIETEAALALAKEDEKTQGQIESLARETRLRTMEAASERAQRNMWLASTVTASLGILCILFLYRRLRSSNRQLEDSNRQLYLSSNYDFLTGLFNRRYLENFVTALLSEPGKSANWRAADEGLILLIDIDHFKRLNDTRGHAVGDQVLKVTALRLSTLFSKDGVVARWGGEEFLALLPTRNVAEAADLASRVLGAVSNNPVVVDGKAIEVTISAGVCRLRLAMTDREAVWDEVLRFADEALYMAKQHGRNRAFALTHVLDASAANMARDLHINHSEGKVTLLEIPAPTCDVARPAC
jgi:diguanylate cyclase (GGDEF)-like protein